jgi:hypothetical protein
MTWCESHQVWKSRHWLTLCKTRADYWQAWEEGRGPGQTPATAEPAAIKPWLRCQHRGSVSHILEAREYGCGCGQIALHTCEHFGEPILLRASDRMGNQLLGRVAGFTGRTCKACPIGAAADVASPQKTP